MLLFTLIGVIMWSFGNLSAYKLPKLALVFLTLCFTLVGVIIWHLWWAGASETFIQNNPTVMTLLFTHSEYSFETLNAYKVPTSCSLTYTSHWQNTVYFLTSQEDLKLQFEIILVFLTQCFTLVGVIIWESQRIQTPKTRTLLFLTLFVEWSFGNLKAYKLLKLALLYTIQVYFP